MNGSPGPPGCRVREMIGRGWTAVAVAQPSGSRGSRPDGLRGVPARSSQHLGGTTVHYMRVEERSVIEPVQGQPQNKPDQDRMVDPDYLDELIDAAVASLTG